MPRDHNYTLSTTVSKWDVRISPSTNYGYFEHTSTGAGGGLWFTGKELRDYDGVFELPRNVRRGIRNLGYSTLELYGVEDLRDA